MEQEVNPLAQRRSLRIVALMAGVLLTQAAEVAAQTATTSSPQWLVEVTGGWTGIAPADLNARADYGTALLDAFKAQPIQQTHDGALEKLDHAVPFGGRVLRRFGTHWMLGAGFSAFSASQESSAGASYHFTVIDPHAQEYQREYSSEITVDPLALDVREYFPHARVGYERPLGGRLLIGAALDAGWIFARCRLDESQATVGGFYPTSSTGTIHMSGSGNSFGADALVSARVTLTRRWGVVVEGGRTWHEVKNVSGSGETAVVIQDGEATEPELTQTRQVNGRWVNRPVQATGGWQGTVPDIAVTGTPFTLSLSGWQVRFGVSLGL